MSLLQFYSAWQKTPLPDQIITSSRQNKKELATSRRNLSLRIFDECERFGWMFFCCSLLLDLTIFHVVRWSRAHDVFIIVQIDLHELCVVCVRWTRELCTRTCSKLNCKFRQNSGANCSFNNRAAEPFGNHINFAWFSFEFDAYQNCQPII